MHSHKKCNSGLVAKRLVGMWVIAGSILVFIFIIEVFLVRSPRICIKIISNKKMIIFVHAG